MGVVESISNFLLVLFQSVALFFQQAIAGSIGYTIPLFFFDVLLFVLIVYAIARTGWLGLVAAGGVFLFAITYMGYVAI